MSCKAGFAVADPAEAGAVIDRDTPLEICDCIRLRPDRLGATPVIPLVPPDGDVSYLQAACELNEEGA